MPERASFDKKTMSSSNTTILMIHLIFFFVNLLLATCFSLSSGGIYHKHYNNYRRGPPKFMPSALSITTTKRIPSVRKPVSFATATRSFSKNISLERIIRPTTRLYQLSDPSNHNDDLLASKTSHLIDTISNSDSTPSKLSSSTYSWFGMLLSDLNFGSIFTFDNWHKLQRIGENIFAGLLSVALLQGIVALGQYRTNPAGQLIIPPGKTVGIAYPTLKHDSNNATATEISQARRSQSTNMKFVGGNATATATATTTIQEEKVTSSAPAGDNNITTSNSTSSSTFSDGVNQYTKILNKINRWLVLLVPWISQQFSFLLARNTHLFHVAFIVTLTRAFDLPHQWTFQRQLRRVVVEQSQTKNVIESIMQLTTGAKEMTSSSSSSSSSTSNNRTTNDTTTNDTTTTTTIDCLPLTARQSQPIDNIMVLGDSLAIGLGSVDVFDSNKNNSQDFALIENVVVGDDDDNTLDDENNDNNLRNTGPIFPRVLAETFSNIENTTVFWRSAGVDGGDTQHIHEFCLDVLKDEVQNHNRIPQLVVLLCGINDLKYFVSKPWPGGNPGPRIFRQRLKSLINEIHVLAPNCSIVLPAIPTQMFQKNSPVNIFPFNFVMDSFIGFWDSLKMSVADYIVDGDDILATTRTTKREKDNSSNSNKGMVLYVRIKPKEVFEWYKAPNPLSDDPAPSTLGSRDLKTDADFYNNEEQGLIAADGVHPNAKCYALWAQSLAEQLLCPRNKTNVE